MKRKREAELHANLNNDYKKLRRTMNKMNNMNNICSYVFHETIDILILAMGVLLIMILFVMAIYYMYQQNKS